MNRRGSVRWLPPLDEPFSLVVGALVSTIEKEEKQRRQSERWSTLMPSREVSMYLITMVFDYDDFKFVKC